MTPPRAPASRRLLLGAALTAAVAGCSDGSPDAGSPTTTSSPADPATSPTGNPATSPATSASPAGGQELDASYVPQGLTASQRSEYRYGDHPRQVSDLWLPTAEHRDAVVVLVHGGAWGADTDRRDVNALVADLVGDGWPVLNVDYRGVGDGGGWDTTFTDVAAAVDAAADAAAEHGLPTDRVAIAGHSAGGHLAVWAAARHTLAAGDPGADPRIVPAFAASMSGVLHPTSLGGEGGDSNVTAVFGGTPEEVDERYAVGDPARRVPLGTPLLVAHGTADETVPAAQAREFAGAARAAGDAVDLRLVEGADHGDPLDPAGRVWPLVKQFVETSLG